ncbi:hypothetical protein L3Q82_008701 [Scortum barcoo]|uniref:Uncharacterized protein n=1 Tax=Scortum barcoo TaxID=214431 RepID=A0ACB8XC29_9TELE|nr:hypothetical protein L3Q82_008701 [Scortum barcoo]
MKRSLQGNEQEDGGGTSRGSQETLKRSCKQRREKDVEEEEEKKRARWERLPQEILLHIFQYLPLLDRAYASQVCRGWNQAFHMPELWRCFEFELNQPATSYLKATHPDLIKQIIKRHANHLQYVSFKVDSSRESAEAACDILSQLVNCSLKTLGLISTARPSFMELPTSHPVPPQGFRLPSTISHFISALTVVFVNSKSLSSLKIDDTPVDDPSLKVLVANNSDTLKLLKMSSCPHVSPAGILCVADQCHGLRELALNYHLLSDELLIALSSEKHVHLEHLRIDVISENPGQQFHTIKKSSWDAMVRHSPKFNLVMYFFLYEDEFGPFFRDEIPVTHLYFGRSVSKDAVCANGLRPLDEELIRIAQRCTQLSAIGLGECEVSCSAFVEFVKMCGDRLTQLSIMEEVLVPDHRYGLDDIHWEVSKHLGRVWFPDMMPTCIANALAHAACERCKSGFAATEKIVNSNGELYHEQCFVCAQCFQQFPEGLFYEFEGRKYCEHDFQMLFAPCCHQCGEFIIGRVIKAMNNSWHPDCFCCDICQAVLADVGFVKNAGRHLCRPCHNREKARGLGKYICQKCHAIIEEQPLIFKNDPYHPDHFNCNNCGKELTAEARELKGELFCLPCHDKMGVPICGACRRPIEGRVVNAMGKQWHVEHFVCAKCEKPFLGHRHYERKGLAYCETHYNQLFGDVCYHCNRVIEGDVVSALNKAWCVNCFSCSTCNTKLTLKNKFVEFDMKPVCKKCYEKFPLELKKRLKKLAESVGRK